MTRSDLEIKEYARAWREANRERYNAHKRKYEKAHWEQKLVSCKKYYNKNMIAIRHTSKLFQRQYRFIKRRTRALMHHLFSAWKVYKRPKPLVNVVTFF